MVRIPQRCLRCMQPMEKGEPAIIIDDFTAFHTECYKKDRIEALEDVGITFDGWLDDAASKWDTFNKAANIDSIKNQQGFYDAWKEMMFIPQLLKLIVNDAQRMSVIGPIHEFQLSKRLNNNYRDISGLAEDYRDGFGKISSQIKQREMFPVFEFPTPKVDALFKLREEEKESLEDIAERMKILSNESKLLIEEVKDISKKLTEAERKHIQNQVYNIDRNTRPLP